MAVQVRDSRLAEEQHALASVRLSSLRQEGVVVPLYEYACSQCRRTKTAMNTVEDRRRNAPTCRCGAFMVIRISPVAGRVVNPAVPKRRK